MSDQPMTHQERMAAIADYWRGVRQQHAEGHRQRMAASDAGHHERVAAGDADHHERVAANDARHHAVMEAIKEREREAG
jgi:hypothetical protein